MSSQKRKGYILIPSPRISTADDEAAPARALKGCLFLVLQSYANPLYSLIHATSTSDPTLLLPDRIHHPSSRRFPTCSTCKSQWLSTSVPDQTEWLACFTPCPESPGP